MSATASSHAPSAVHIIDARLTYPGWSEGGLNRSMVEAAVSHFERERAAAESGLLSICGVVIRRKE